VLLLVSIHVTITRTNSVGTIVVMFWLITKVQLCLTDSLGFVAYVGLKPYNTLHKSRTQLGVFPVI